MNTRLLLLCCAAFTFGGCARYASVTERRPQFHPARRAAGVRAGVKSRIVSALHRKRSEPLVAMSEYLSAAEAAAQQPARTPADSAAREDYNFAVARVFG